MSESYGKFADGVPPVQDVIIPTVYKEGRGGYDIFSLVMEDRVIWIPEQVSDPLASVVCSQLLWLDRINSKKDITMYINSPGGSVTAGMAMYDTMNYISCDVATVSIGMSCSMGAFLLSAGAKGKRAVLPNTRVMIHQPSGGTQGTVTDMERQFNLIKMMKKDLNIILAANCRREDESFEDAFKRIQRDVERDYWMDAEECIQYGIADKIIQRGVNHFALKRQLQEAGIEL